MLENRAAFIRGNCEWWHFTWPLHKDHFNSPRIFTPYRARTNQFAVDTSRQFIGLTDTTVLYDTGQPESLHYIAAILNSNVMTYRHQFLAKRAGGATYEFFENTVSKLPIPRRQPGDPDHDNITRIARALEQSIATEKSTSIATELQTAAQKTQDLWTELNDAVYDLFDLNPDERAHIEGQLGP